MCLDHVELGEASLEGVRFGQSPMLLGHTSKVTGLAITRYPDHQLDGKWVFSFSDDKSIRKWSLESGECLVEMEDEEGVNCMAISHDGRFLFCGDGDGGIVMRSTMNGELTRRFRGSSSSGGVKCLVVSPDDQYIYSGHDNGSIQKWSLSTGQCVFKMEMEDNSSITAMVLSNDGKHLYSSSSDHTIRVWETETGKRIHQLTGHTDHVSTLVLSLDGQHLYSGAYDKTIRVWSTLQLTSECDCEQVLTGQTGAVTSLVVSPDGLRLYSGSDDQTIRVWSTQNGECIRILQGHTSAVLCLAMSADGQQLLSGSYDETIRVWSTTDGELVRALPSHTAEVWAVSVSSESTSDGQDGDRLYSASTDGTLREWSTITGECLQVKSMSEMKDAQLPLFPSKSTMHHMMNSGSDVKNDHQLHGHDEHDEKKDIAMAVVTRPGCIRRGNVATLLIKPKQINPSNLSQVSTLKCYFGTPSLTAKGCQFQGAHIDPTNRRLLEQLASVEENEDADDLIQSLPNQSNFCVRVKNKVCNE